MAASSSKCTAEEWEKARADVRDLYDRIPDECKFYKTETEAWAKRLEEREAKKKKKLCVMPPHRVQMILNYKFPPLDEHTGLEWLEKNEGKEKYRDLRTMMNACDTLHRHYHDLMTSYQEKIRHELETNGYVMHEATDDDEEEEEGEEGVAVVHQRFQGGGGRRRHRPGVTKSGRGGVVKRLN